MPQSDSFTAEQYLLEDYRHTLFPLSTTRLLVEKCAPELREYLVSNPFRPQTRCSAAKKAFHLRRTVKLDPPSELFIYDLVFRNRQKFRRDHNPARSSFGFLFKNGRPISSKAAYQDYRKELSSAKSKHEFGIRFDVSSYFNSLYHHDLVSRFREIGSSEDDVAVYGRFLREINSGRSLDCLPHGLHPCKVLGADFLKFVDNSLRLTSPRLIRFLDDFNLFGDRERAIHADFNCVQELLSEKGLFLNDGKTAYANDFGRSMTEKIDGIKADLLQARRKVVDSSGIEASDFITLIEDENGDCEYIVTGAEDEDDLGESDLLTEEQTKYLLELLNQPDIEESDAELALVLLRDHGDEVLERMREFLIKFPGLSRTIYDFSAFVEDKTELCSLVLSFLRGEQFVTEYQLFWITKMLEDHLSDQPCYGTALALLNDHPSSTPIARAKLLEIPEPRFGMPDLREAAIRSGQCDWPSWAAAIGCRAEDPAKRNHLLGYFKNGGPMNKLIGSCAEKL
jgi:reverse transcriptase-like protein